MTFQKVGYMTMLHYKKNPVKKW